MAIITLFVRKNHDPEALTLMKRLKKEGYSDLSELIIEQAFHLEGEMDSEEVKRLLPLFTNPLSETSSFQSTLDDEEGPIIEICYKKAVIDPELDSILDGARALGVEELKWARLSRRYQFKGLNPSQARDAVKRKLFNPVIQVIVDPEETWDSLRPGGTPDDVRHISLQGLTDEALERLSMKNFWYAPLPQLKAIQRYEENLGRPLTDAEIEIFVQSWSDHCYHTTWKSLGLLKMLKSATEKIDHPLVVSVFTDNAGGIDFYDDWVVTIKGETHNYPSSIATFGGVATKHGGVIRDTMGFGKGAYPIGGSTVMGTMDPATPESDIPAGALHPAHIVRESIRATDFYCNPMGIPMMYPVYKAHPGYPKCLALGHSIGIIPKEYALKDKPLHGDFILLIGGRTGRDGLHGATASSAGMVGTAPERESAAVQIGHPLLERKILEAIPLLRDAGCIRSITDLGAGGISSAAGEMGADTGILLNLDVVPLKDPSLTAWEIILSESQERMLIALPPEKEEEAMDILKEYGIEATIIGKFSGTERFQAMWRGEMVVDIGMDFLWNGCPIVPMDVEEPEKKSAPSKIPPMVSLDEVLKASKAVLSHYNCCDQSLAGFQFDSTAQGRTVVGPYGGITGKMPTDVFVSAPILGKRYGVMSTLAYNPFYGDVSSEGLARLMMIEAISKAVAAGADIGAIALCDNFYTPAATPQVGWALKTMVKTIADLSVRLGTPFISGKDSSSGTFKSSDGKVIDVPYTFAVSTLCRIPDVSKVVTKEFKESGNSIIFLGRISPDKLGGSVYLDTYGERGDELHDLGDDWIDELKLIWEKLYQLYQSPGNPIKAAATIGEGGIIKRIFEMCYGGGLGARLRLDDREDAGKCGFTGRLDGLLFGEAIGSMILEVDASAALDDIFSGLPWFPLGETVSSHAIELRRDGEILSLDMDQMIRAWETTFKEVIG